MPGRPLAAQYCIAILMATSTDTEPESAKNTVCKLRGVISTSFRARVTAGSCVRPPNMTWAISFSCAVTASFSAG